MLHFSDPARGALYLTRDDPTGFAAPPAFGPFRVLHQIGVGALGPVFRTYEPARDRLVAVKVFRLDITPEQASALADELARATEAGLFHPSIVEPVAAGLEGTVAYRAEEYVAAESLDVAMRHYAPAALDKALPFISQLASAIDFARAAGVGHGALHPRDIFVTPDEARATGFGVVDALDRLRIRAPVRRPYSPPERIAAEPWGIAADVFSLAVIAFELLTGRRPSGVGDQMGPLTGASLGTHADAIRAVLVKAMHEDPAERYASAGAFAAALALAAELEAAAPAAAVRREPVETPPQVEKVSPGLEDFSEESITPAHAETAREVARKVIAARKRQSREREKEKEKTASQPAVPVEPSEVEVEPAPVDVTAADAFKPAEVDLKPAGVEVDSADVDFRPASGHATHEDVAVKAEEVAEIPVETPETPAPLETPEPAAVAFAALEPPEPLAAGPTEPDSPILRDTHERVVAVEEFRLREGSLFRPERTRPRSDDRASPESLHRAKPEPAEPVLDRVDTDVPLLSHDEPPHDRPRVALLPLVLMSIPMVGLGYFAGYVVGSRDAAAERTGAAATASAPASSDLTTPGTSGQTPSRDYTEGAVDRSAAPAPPAAESKPAAPPPSPSPAPAAIPKTGQIVVTSTPAKAAVTINGEWSGRTPLTLNRPFGTYVVRVVEKGYQVALEKVQLSAKSPRQTMTVTLRPTPGATRAPAAAKPAPESAAARTGEIYVDSRPQGARVLVDGKLQGVTPLRLTKQAVGSHDVRLELEDHEPWTATTQVTAGATARVSGSLERIR